MCFDALNAARSARNTHWLGNTGDNSTLDGPWVGADLEAGMYYGGGDVTKVNPQNKPLTFPFVSLYLRGKTDGFTLKGGDATNGTLMTMYDGARPDCKIAGVCDRHKNATYTPSYQPMHKQGAIVLATGGDMSNSALGNFYEGIMTTGCTTDATDEAVQANIVAVGYKNIPPPPPPPAPHCAEVAKSTCYADHTDRTMGDYVLRSEDMTREQCIQLCFSRLNTLAGVENGNQCMCGDAVKPNVKPSNACTFPCTGNSTETCGGSWVIDIMHFACTPPTLLAT